MSQIVGEFELEKDIEVIVTLENGTPIIPLITYLSWTTERKGTCGVLEFEVLKEKIEFTEGDRVSVRYKGVPFFLGYIFKRERTKAGKIKVTAYDQLRYLKNKDTYIFKNMTASEIIKALAKDFNLQTGEIEDTKYKIVKRREDNKTLLDMVLYALSETLYYTKKQYILYDDYGKITLKEDEKMRIFDLIFDDKSATDFKYNTSIDSNTYNQIKLSRINKEKKVREIFIVKDPFNIKKWGVLQFFENIDEKVTDAKAKEKVENLLKLYNHKRRTFSMQKIFGDIRVRGGSSMAINLNVGDIIVQNFMIVNKVKHKFEFQKHTMDIDFIGQMGIKESEKNGGHSGTVEKTEQKYE
ncbi:MAG: hydrolase [Bacteroidota bacterium]|nr:hydrolase [Bacteroidota bacterium]